MAMFFGYFTKTACVAQTSKSHQFSTLLSKIGCNVNAI